MYMWQVYLFKGICQDCEIYIIVHGHILIVVGSYEAYILTVVSYVHMS